MKAYNEASSFKKIQKPEFETLIKPFCIGFSIKIVSNLQQMDCYWEQNLNYFLANTAPKLKGDWFGRSKQQYISLWWVANLICQ